MAQTFVLRPFGNREGSGNHAERVFAARALLRQYHLCPVLECYNNQDSNGKCDKTDAFTNQTLCADCIEQKRERGNGAVKTWREEWSNLTPRGLQDLVVPYISSMSPTPPRASASRGTSTYVELVEAPGRIPTPSPPRPEMLDLWRDADDAGGDDGQNPARAAGAATHSTPPARRSRAGRPLTLSARLRESTEGTSPPKGGRRGGGAGPPPPDDDEEPPGGEDYGEDNEYGLPPANPPPRDWVSVGGTTGTEGYGDHEPPDRAPNIGMACQTLANAEYITLPGMRVGLLQAVRECLAGHPLTHVLDGVPTNDSDEFKEGCSSLLAMLSGTPLPPPPSAAHGTAQPPIAAPESPATSATITVTPKRTRVQLMVAGASVAARDGGSLDEHATETATTLGMPILAQYVTAAVVPDLAQRVVMFVDDNPIMSGLNVTGKQEVIRRILRGLPVNLASLGAARIAVTGTATYDNDMLHPTGADAITTTDNLYDLVVKVLGDKSIMAAILQRAKEALRASRERAATTTAAPHHLYDAVQRAIAEELDAATKTSIRQNIRKAAAALAPDTTTHTQPSYDRVEGIGRFDLTLLEFDAMMHAREHSPRTFPSAAVHAHPPTRPKAKPGTTPEWRRPVTRSPVPAPTHTRGFQRLRPYLDEFVSDGNPVMCMAYTTNGRCNKGDACLYGHDGAGWKTFLDKRGVANKLSGTKPDPQQPPAM